MSTATHRDRRSRPSGCRSAGGCAWSAGATCRRHRLRGLGALPGVLRHHPRLLRGQHADRGLPAGEAGPRGAQLHLPDERSSTDNFKAMLDQRPVPVPDVVHEHADHRDRECRAALFMGAAAAFAFSRLRFTGRRPGLLLLMLVQMFPAVLADHRDLRAAPQIRDVFPAFGLGTIWGLIARVPRRRAGREHLPDEGLLRHHPGRHRRVGADRRRRSRADLLRADPAAGHSRSWSWSSSSASRHVQRAAHRVRSSLPDQQNTTAGGRPERPACRNPLIQEWGLIAAGGADGGDPAVHPVPVHRSSHLVTGLTAGRRRRADGRR